MGNTQVKIAVKELREELKDFKDEVKEFRELLKEFLKEQAYDGTGGDTLYEWMLSGRNFVALSHC
jgi:hypothetical protein